MSDDALNTNVTTQAAEPSEEALLRETLKRCSAETVEAALAFKASGDARLVPTVVLGIVQRFLDPEMAEKLKVGDESLRFMEDLGMDSLTMIEAIMMVEESLGVSIKNEELIDLRTVGDLKRFIEGKVSGANNDEPAKFYPIEQIAAVMPQQEPFLFLQSAEILDDKASGTYQISGREAFLAGHFKGDPVFPASILLESLGQLGVFHFLKTNEGADGSEGRGIYFTGADGVRCQRICRPGDTLQLNVELKRRHDPMVVYSGRMTVNGEKTVSVDEITLFVSDAGQTTANPGL